MNNQQLLLNEGDYQKNIIILPVPPDAVTSVRSRDIVWFSHSSIWLQVFSLPISHCLNLVQFKIVRYTIIEYTMKPRTNIELKDEHWNQGHILESRTNNKIKN